MAVITQESKCVTLKRRGSEHVANLIEGMSLQEQVDFWKKRTRLMIERQKEFLEKQALAKKCD